MQPGPAPRVTENPSSEHGGEHDGEKEKGEKAASKFPRVYDDSAEAKSYAMVCLVNVYPHGEPNKKREDVCSP